MAMCYNCNMKYEPIRDLSAFPYIVECRNSSSFAHFHYSVELIYVVDGKMTVTVNGNTRELERNQIAFAESYLTHSNTPSPECDSISLVIPSEYFTNYKNKAKNYKIPEFLCDESFNARILFFLEMLLDSVEKKSDLLIKGYIDVILGELLEKYGVVRSESSDKSREIVEIINYIYENYDSPLTLESIAKHFNYNKFYFSKLFNKYLNCSLSHYLGAVRMQKVRERLATDRRSITDIALDCGFNSLSTFYRYYKLYGGAEAAES